MFETLGLHNRYSLQETEKSFEILFDVAIAFPVYLL